MYPTLRAEMARRKIFIKDLAEVINCTVSTMSLKLSGKAPLLFSEAVAIKNFIGSEIPLEELFRREEA